jgi:hypothetical protein
MPWLTCAVHAFQSFLCDQRQKVAAGLIRLARGTAPPAWRLSPLDYSMPFADSRLMRQTSD